MAAITLKNRSLKVSPGGIVTLPVSARKALGMEPKKGSRVTIAIDGDKVVVRRSGDAAGTRISPKGQLELIGDARALLEGGEKRHYWCVSDDHVRSVFLHPYKL